MAYFKAKMHKIRFWLGLRPRPRWGSSQRCPRPSSWILGVLLLRGGTGGEGGKGRDGKGREDPLDLLPPEKFSSYATAADHRRTAVSCGFQAYRY